MPFAVRTPSSERVQDTLASAGQKTGRALERLASGRRLNAAVDDAAGLAVADGLQRDRALQAQAVRNAGDGVSALRIAESALSRVGDLTGRLAELATQAASGFLSDAQRATLSAEASQLQAEIDRLGDGTHWNGQALFGNTIAVRVGVAPDGTEVQVGGDALSAAALGLGTTDLSTQAGAQAALDATAAAGDVLAQRRAALGAAGAQLAAAVRDLRVRYEETAAAESRLRDADMAAEAAALVGGEIRSRLAVAVAAQANQASRAVVELLD